VLIDRGFFAWKPNRESTVANQLAMDKVKSVKHLEQLGYSERRIAQHLGISRIADRNHLDRNRPKDTKAPTGSDSSNQAPSAPVSGSECEPFREVILDMLARGLTAQRIHQDLQSEHGFTAKYPSVRRYVARLSGSTDPSIRRIECEPGDEMQVDFGIGARCKNHEGKLIKMNVFRAVLSHSRKGYPEAVTKMTTERFIQVLENAFWRLGGVPKVVVFDNGSCAVKHADWYDAELHPKIVDFCKHYHFELVPTRPRTPRHKGKIERGIGYVKNNALKGITFESLVAQNELLDRWESTVADTRIHGTTKKQVGQCFEQIERNCLQELPKERLPFYEKERRKVSRDGHIAVKHAFYSVPPEYLGCEVWVRWNSKIRRNLNDRIQIIATHCTRELGRFSTLDEHIVPEKVHGIEKGMQFLLRKVRFLGAPAARWAEMLIEERGVQAARSLQGLLSLSKKFTSDDMNRACDLAWRSKATNYPPSLTPL
jgi:transposase